MKLSPWVFALIISCSLSYGQYGKDFEDMSQSEKHMVYNSYRKSPALGVLYELFLPSSGYAYTNKWKRGLIIAVIARGSIFYANNLFTAANEFYDDAFYYGEDHPKFDGLYDLGGKKETRGAIFMAIGISTFIFELYDVSKQTKKYNHNLYRKIFGKEPPSFSLNLQPTYQGANLTLAYKFD